MLHGSMMCMKTKNKLHGGGGGGGVKTEDLARDVFRSEYKKASKQTLFFQIRSPMLFCAFLLLLESFEIRIA
jgi:hypothetical protein